VTEPLLSVSNLCVDFETEQGVLNVLDHVSFSLYPGKTLGLVGESGCGKSVTSLALMKLLQRPYGNITNGSILFKGQDLVKYDSKSMQALRGNRIAMIFQDPMTALNPVKTIGSQILEVFNLHRKNLSKKERYQAALDMLKKVGIPDSGIRMNEFPHQLSGGMRQRVMIAIALSCEPDILIADEPTTALDVTIQAQILDLMQVLQKENGMAILFITHDLGVIAELCDDVAVMYAGRVIEKANVKGIFMSPKHPYTKGLLDSIPQLFTKDKAPLNTIEGQVPSLANMPKGCRFKNRCQHSQSDCDTLNHELDSSPDQHKINCKHWREIKHA
jgi:peptide/nickel transport system ATP-binding protein